MNFDNDFLKILKRISYNKIASTIYNLKDDNRNLNYDYIVKGDNNNIVLFLTSNHVEELKNKIVYYTVNCIRNLTHSNSNNTVFNKIGYNKEIQEYWYPVPGDKGFIINECISNSGKYYVLFKCANSGRLAVINKDAIIPADIDFFSKSKNKIRIGKLAKNILEMMNIEFKNKDIEEFVNLYKSSYDLINNRGNHFRLVSGDEIAHWYNIKNYEFDNRGSLSSSCMANKNPEYFDIYTKNKNCSLLILLSDSGILRDGHYTSDKICGRALVWKGKLRKEDNSLEDITIVDRIYTNNDSDVNLFYEYAKKMGWFYKKNNNNNSIYVTIGDSEIKHNFLDEDYLYFTSEVIIPLENYLFKYYPYMDTFSYLKDGYLTNVLSIKNKTNKCHYRCFRSTDGSYGFTNIESDYIDDNTTGIDDNLPDMTINRV